MFNLLQETQLISSLILTGLIWTIQLVHYPSFRFVSTEDFVEFESFHTFRISIIVMPLMLIELFTGVVIAFESNWGTVLSMNLALIIAIWLFTFFFSVPCHKVLALRKDDEAIHKLVSTNWFRTVLWTIKSILLVIYY